MAEDKEIKLTQKQELFCREYVISGNATASAIKAGYKENTANVIGSENLAKPYIKKRIEELLAPVIEKQELTLQMVVEELRRQAFFDPRKLYYEDGNLKNVPDLDDDTASAIGEVHRSRRILGKNSDDDSDELVINEEFKYKANSKNQALDMLMKYFGGYSKDNGQKLPELMESMLLPFKIKKTDE